jgi:hypothetical protein
MEPIQVAGALMTQYMNGLSMTGPFAYPGREGSAVRVWLPNGYGISLGNGYCAMDEYPEVVAIRARDIDNDLWDYAPHACPSLPAEERGCTPQRAYEILSHLKTL